MADAPFPLLFLVAAGGHSMAAPFFQEYCLVVMVLPRTSIIRRQLTKSDTGLAYCTLAKAAVALQETKFLIQFLR